MRCGICNTKQSQLQCHSCVNFALLKPKLQYLDTLEAIDALRGKVDSCLGHCINGADYDFVTRFLKGELEKGVDNVDDATMNGVVALSSQLLSIDTRIIKRKQGKISKEVELCQRRNDELKAKMVGLKVLLVERRKKKQGQRGAAGDKTSTEQVIKRLTEEKEFKQQDNNNLTKQINNSKSLLYQELINIYVIKRRKISGTTRSVFMISFIPLLSCRSLVDYNYEVVNASLGQVCRFILQVSSVLLVVLPFHVGVSKGVHSIQGVELHLKGRQQVWELDNLELRTFVQGIAMLIVDVYEVLRVLELHSELKCYGDLLQLDCMVYKLANNGFSIESLAAAVTGGARSMMANGGQRPLMGNVAGDVVDLGLLKRLCYEAVLSRIRHKDSEWHVVKREYLE